MGNRITFSLSMLLFWIRGYAEIKDSSVEFCTANVLFDIFPAGKRIQTFFLRKISDMEVNMKYEPGFLVPGLILLFLHGGFTLFLLWILLSDNYFDGHSIFDLFRALFTLGEYGYSFLCALWGAYLVVCSYVSRLTVHLTSGHQTLYEVSVPFYERKKLEQIQNELQRAIH